MLLGTEKHTKLARTAEITDLLVGPSGPVVVIQYSPLDPRFAGSNTAEVDDFF